MENFVYTNHSRCNVGNLERIVSVLAGGFMLYQAFRNPKALAVAVPGGLILARGITGYCPAYDLMGKQEVHRHNINIKTHLVINRPVEEVYAFWRKLENLPLFMKHLESVSEKFGTASQWTAKLPGGVGSISWNAVIVNEKPNEVLGWKSVQDSAIDNAGKVEFTRLEEDVTGLHVVISYRAPLGVLGENIARMFTPQFRKMIQSDIDNFRVYMENGFLPESGSDFRNELI